MKEHKVLSTSQVDKNSTEREYIKNQVTNGRKNCRKVRANLTTVMLEQNGNIVKWIN
jgi:hypothetical protein